MISISKKATEVANYFKTKLNISSDSLFSTAAFLGLATVALTPDIASAATAPSTTVISGVVCNIVDELQGPIVRAIAAFAVIFLGFSLFLGKISWGVALALGIGLAAVFGAEQIVDVMAGAGSGDACTNSTTAIGVNGVVNP
jgi:type IV secretion system protein VirB2